MNKLAELLPVFAKLCEMGENDLRLAIYQRKSTDKTLCKLGAFVAQRLPLPRRQLSRKMARVQIVRLNLLSRKKKKFQTLVDKKPVPLCKIKANFCSTTTLTREKGGKILDK